MNVVFEFGSTGFADFGFDPVAVHAVFSEDEKEFVMQVDSLIYLRREFLASFEFFGGVPATDTAVLEFVVEVSGKGFVFFSVANEAGMVVDAGAGK